MKWAFAKKMAIYGMTAEAIDDRLRLVARRVFGFRSPSALIAMYHRCADLIPVNPFHPLPTPP
jgi:hypothetical protein